MEKERQIIVDELVSKEARHWIKERFKTKTNWKNSEKARQLRIKGNEMFAAMQKNDLEMEEIFKIYSLSIANAESDSEELSLGYGNRSAILFRMQKYKECIADVDSVLKMNISRQLRVKLLCRKAESMIKLGLICDSIKFVLEAENLVSTMKDDDADKKNLKNLIDKIQEQCVTFTEPVEEKNHHNQVPKHIKLLNKKLNENPFDSVSIRWDKTNGRYLVANRDFKPGEIIFVEESYAKVPNTTNYYNVCCHCLTASWTTIPCNYCTWCMFCSEECKKKSWELYHKIECVIVEQLFKKFGDFSKFDHLAIRVLLRGVREAGGIKNLKEEIENIDTCTDMCTKGFEKNGLFQTMGLKSLYTFNDVNNHLLGPCNNNIVFILISLVKYTSFFNENIECNIEHFLLNDEVLFTGALLLKLSTIIAINFILLPKKDCKYSNTNFECKSVYCCFPGFGIAIMNPLLNNNCNPQAIEIKSEKSHKFIICSIQPIKKNTEISIAYCGDFSDLPKRLRQELLKLEYNFTCKCKACEENWPSKQYYKNLLLKNGKIPSNSKEKFYLGIESDTINSILKNDYKTEYTLNSVKMISNIMSKAYEELKHPSIALSKLENCMSCILTRLYKGY